MKNPATPAQSNPKPTPGASIPTLAESPPTTAGQLTPTAAKQADRRKRWHQARLRREYSEQRLFFAEAFEEARCCGWYSPWAERKIKNLDFLLSKQGPEAAAETRPGAPPSPASRCGFGTSSACLYSLPSLANPSASPSGPALAGLRFPLYKEDHYPLFERGEPPVMASFRHLHWLVTDPTSPLRASTEALEEQLPDYPYYGQDAFWLPNAQAAAFAVTAPLENFDPGPASGLGVLHFAVNPERFTDRAYQDFICDPFAGISPPLVVNGWPSGCGLTAVVVLPTGPGSYAQKIEDLVLHFHLYRRYPGLECQLWQNQDPARPCGLYWDAHTHFRQDVLA